MPRSEDGLYRYRVDFRGSGTWLITPLPIAGIDEDHLYPMKEWLDSSGGMAFFVLTMPDGKERRIVNHPYVLDIAAAELITPAPTWGELNART